MKDTEIEQIEIQIIYVRFINYTSNNNNLFL